MMITQWLLVWDNDASTFKKANKGTPRLVYFCFNKFTLKQCLVLWTKFIIYCISVFLHSSAFLLCLVKQESSLKAMVMILPLSGSGPLKFQNANLSTTKSNYIHCMPTGTQLPRSSYINVSLFLETVPYQNEWH